jgi:tRNA (cmo5U34)-methyltransferase
MANTHRDKLFAKPLGKVPKFVFDRSVVDVFPDMIQRSVPGYQTIINHTGELADRFVKENSHCYDLGCSLGASTLAVRERIENRNATIYAVDNSQAMLDKLTTILESQPSSTHTTLIRSDICDIQITNASLVILNFTLQFVPLARRAELISHIYQGLNLNGCLIISEKLHFEPEPLNQLLNELHHQFKRDQGYSDLEISQKRDAIDKVLMPETLDAHIDRLKQCGFKSVSPWFQCYNFGSLIAIK